MTNSSPASWGQTPCCQLLKHNAWPPDKEWWLTNDWSRIPKSVILILKCLDHLIVHTPTTACELKLSGLENCELCKKVLFFKEWSKGSYFVYLQKQNIKNMLHNINDKDYLNKGTSQISHKFVLLLPPTPEEASFNLMVWTCWFLDNQMFVWWELDVAH